jgi:hypothetical protein
MVLRHEVRVLEGQLHARATDAVLSSEVPLPRHHVPKVLRKVHPADLKSVMWSFVHGIVHRVHTVSPAVARSTDDRLRLRKIRLARTVGRSASALVLAR